MVSSRRLSDARSRVKATRAGTTQRHHGDPIQRVEAVDETRGRRQRLTALDAADVRLIDGHDDEAAGVDVFVRGEVPRRDGRALRCAGGADELHGRHRAELAVHFEDEIGRPEAGDWPAVGSDDRRVHGDEVDSRSKYHVLTRRLTGPPRPDKGPVRCAKAGRRVVSSLTLRL